MGAWELLRTVAAREQDLPGTGGAMALAAALLFSAACAGKAMAPGGTTGGLGQPCSGGACTAPYVCDGATDVCIVAPGSCGNGVVDVGEQCDGTDLAGQTCASRGLPGTGLACTAGCSFDTSACVAPGSVFPLAISASKNGLVDASGRPFLMQGDAAWSAIAELNEADATIYLADRQSRGFNTILVNLIEHQFTNHTPYQANAAGDLPFSNLNDFSTPNDAYFAHADWFIDQALARGMLVLLAPAYMGWSGTQDGWIDEMKASGTTKLGIYGQYLGNRYKNRPNIIWVHGGDYTPVGSEIDLVAAIVDGIQAAGDAHLRTAHWGGEPTYPGQGYTPHPAWIDIDTIYYTDPPKTYTYAIDGYNQDGGVRPIFFIEGHYYNEYNTTRLQVRSQMYQPLAAGEVGSVMGIGTLWNFWSGGSGGNVYANDAKYPQGWKQALGSVAAGDAQRAAQFFAALPFQDLVPDGSNTLITAGYGSWGAASYVLGAMTADGSVALAYFTLSTTIAVDMSRMKGTTTARWFDPSDGSFAAIAGSPFLNSGSHSFTPPGLTSDGSADWVLLLDAR